MSDSCVTEDYLAETTWSSSEFVKQNCKNQTSQTETPPAHHTENPVSAKGRPREGVEQLFKGQNGHGGKEEERSRQAHAKTKVITHATGRGRNLRS
ncbi:hypothetical protein PAL_GLEAN10010307 [Pteropus alecto]|uniref:Uncharacterized protein n=1 Tax=Pteropus alecto TaxID=9402 RepID=L5KJ02_PTEAL|nr:hypothetical protein PAL_GLEAN10010307 [Pteropus alecto]